MACCIPGGKKRGGRKRGEGGGGGRGEGGGSSCVTPGRLARLAQPSGREAVVESEMSLG